MAQQSDRDTISKWSQMKLLDATEAAESKGNESKKERKKEKSSEMFGKESQKGMH